MESGWTYASETMERIFGMDSERFPQDVNSTFEWLGILVYDGYCMQFASGTLMTDYKQEISVTSEGKIRWIKNKVFLSGDWIYIVVMTDVAREKESA